jgi:quinol-cytochrome oxidoreductase complex cytochrome b subunit
MTTAFMGYVLPWGQMSFWGATVITNLISPIPNLVEWVCGSFLVSDATIKRFFIYHFILPFITLLLIFIHLFYLHYLSSNNPLSYNLNNKFTFFPFIFSKDFLGLYYLCILFTLQIYFGILSLSHPDNAFEVSGLVTPLHIVPEWYFLSFYAILKAIPNKNAGFLILLSSNFLFLSFGEFRSLSLFSSLYHNGHFTAYSYFLLFIALFWIGFQLPVAIFLSSGRSLHGFYFAFAFTLWV